MDFPGHPMEHTLTSTYLQALETFRIPMSLTMATRIVRTRGQQNRDSSPSSANRTQNRSDPFPPELLPLPVPLMVPIPRGGRSSNPPTFIPAPPTASTTTTRNPSTLPQQNQHVNPVPSIFSHWTSSSHVVHLWPRNSEPDSDDDNHLPPLRTSQRGEANIDDDASYLAALASGEFSSPSTYPPFNRPATQQTENRSENQSGALPPFPRRLPPFTSAAAPRDPSSSYRPAYLPGTQPAAPRTPRTPRTASQLSSSTNATDPLSDILGPDFLHEPSEDRALEYTEDTPQTSFSSDTMPQTRRRSRAAASAAQPELQANKRRRTSVNPSPRTQTKPTPPKTRRQHRASKDLDSLFGSPQRQNAAADTDPHDDLPTIDLTEATEVPEELKKPAEDNRVKVSAFQCVICMDDVTALTVTHCGHLYCAECLHSSLNVEVTKGKCPMCRQRLDMKPREDYNSKTRGYWPLELKLMTATRKGKRKADSDS